MPSKPQPTPRSAYAHFETIPTRWGDNDVYGHVNNVVYYGYFDTVVNRHLLTHGVLDLHASPVIGLVVHNQCNFFSSIRFPDTVHAGMKVLHLGRSSVRYEIALFCNDASLAAAVGEFVHVYTERASNQAVPIPEPVRALLQGLIVAAA